MDSASDPKFWEDVFDKLWVVGGVLAAVVTAAKNARKKLWKAVTWMFRDEADSAPTWVTSIIQAILAANQTTTDNFRGVLEKYGHDVSSIKSVLERMDGEIGDMRQDITEIRRSIDVLMDRTPR